jgi:hypothetical protein
MFAKPKPSNEPSADTPKSPPIRLVLPATLFLLVVGWGGLYLLMDSTPPVEWQPVWLFFFLFFLAATGVALPVMAFLNRRFPPTPPATPGVVLREAIWVGMYFPTLAWLLAGEVLNTLIAVLLAVGLLLIEGLLRLREQSEWKP